MKTNTRKIFLALMVLGFSLAAQNKIRMAFSLKAADDYFAVPYPNDLHRYPEGRVDRANFPVPSGNPLSTHYRSVADGRDGFGLTESAFFRFSGSIDQARLPSVEQSLKPDSPIFLVNIDRSSPGYGERIPVYCYFHMHATGPLHNLLAISPYPGFVLREKTIYAAVVLRSLDQRLESPKLLKELLSGKNPGGELGAKAQKIYQPLARYLREKNIALEDVAAATVYTTGEPTMGLRDIMQWIQARPARELDTALKPYRDHPRFYALAGSFTAPQFQTGSGSELARGGKIIFDHLGNPVVQRCEKIPVKVMVPKGKMPAKGFPLVIYLHGGANTSDEFLDHFIKSKKDQFTPGMGPARTFAEQNIAGVSLGIVKNPERYHGIGARGRLAELPFYNFFRPEVLTYNHWQASADAAMLLRLMKNLAIDPGLCPETDASASPDRRIHFDPSLFFAMGFSMGGTILGVWSGVEPDLIAAIPAGASGHWGLLMRNFTQVPAKPYVFAWVTGGRPSEAMDSRWPAISLVQAALEPCDTIIYAPYVFRRPLPGAPPKNVYLAVGKNDYYTKTITQNAIITALGLPLAGEVIEPEILTTQKLMGYDAPLKYPVGLNAKSDDGKKVTAAAVQYLPDTWTNEGHNVDYNLTETKHQYGCFLRTLIDTGIAVVPMPGPEGAPCEPPN